MIDPTELEVVAVPAGAPDDLAIVGFDDSPHIWVMAPAVEPALDDKVLDSEVHELGELDSS